MFDMDSDDEEYSDDEFTYGDDEEYSDDEITYVDEETYGDEVCVADVEYEVGDCF